ncbi:MAG: flagellar hook-basal body protein FliE [Hyphomicrobiales bacterium]|nr:flagellar hook-basal body protein FliE [Hyphomicrobiales bacterium]
MIDSVSLIASTRSSGVPISGGASVSAAAGAGGADFSKVLSDVVGGAVDTVKAGEAASIQGLQGKMPLQDVVDAVMSAERTFQTALALRDKAVGAYQEISRMAI